MNDLLVTNQTARLSGLQAVLFFAYEPMVLRFFRIHPDLLKPVLSRLWECSHLLDFGRDGEVSLHLASRISLVPAPADLTRLVLA